VPLKSLLGKLCYTKCEKDKMRCKPEKLITEVTDLNDPVQYQRFVDADMRCRSGL